MSNRFDRVWRWGVRRADFVAAAALTAGVAVVLAVHGLFGSPSTVVDSVGALAFTGMVVWRRRHPVIVAAVSGGLLILSVFSPTVSSVYNSSVTLSTLGVIALFLYAYALGSHCPWPLSLVGMVPLTVGLAVTMIPLNPLVGILTTSPWVAGLLVASRSRAAVQLEVRIRELDQEREAFAAESVRYERARIARELHDIVAHCVSLMVVQAGAGERLVVGNPAGAAEAFESISEAARQADAEIDRLTNLLGTASLESPLKGLRIVEDLVGRVQASGLLVSCQFSGDIEDLSEQSAEAAYRLVQEALTNSMKHAPGAPIAVTVRGNVADVTIRITNEGAREVLSGLEDLGGGHGLIGMRDRVWRCGGTFTAGPTSDRGWQVTASLPRHLRRATAPLVR